MMTDEEITKLVYVSKYQPHMHTIVGAFLERITALEKQCGLNPADPDPDRLYTTGAPTPPFDPVKIALESESADRLKKVLEFIQKYSQIDGAHHKAWVVDQVTRIITGNCYEAFIASYKAGEDGPETYDWDEGTAP